LPHSRERKRKKKRGAYPRREKPKDEDVEGKSLRGEEGMRSNIFQTRKRGGEVAEKSETASFKGKGCAKEKKV